MPYDAARHHAPLRGRMPPWRQILDLFTPDDGSLPDVFIDGMSYEEMIDVYAWVTSQCGVFGNPTAWHKAEQRDIPLALLPSAARSFVDGDIEGFRHGLVMLRSAGVELPELTLCLEAPDCISFDYRKGPAWTEATITAFLAFLAQIHRRAPGATIWHAEEGGADRPTVAFEKALRQFEAQTADEALNTSCTAGTSRSSRC
ncbi:hypothetical protein [Mitsuaria sp. 7]|uniref:hypothetical protein n=1 Tax=Mitsuaria sp. 7 TaxID=1658665 RepID=UPI0012FCEBAD|nr:hypothetical protein [Mitsuaria sp. 7]